MQARGPRHLRANAPVLKDKQDGTEPVLPARWLQGPDNTLDFGGVSVRFIHRNGGHTPGDMLVVLPASGVVFTGDVVYTDRILGLHPVSKTKTWVASFEALEALNPPWWCPATAASPPWPRPGAIPATCSKPCVPIRARRWRRAPTSAPPSKPLTAPRSNT